MRIDAHRLILTGASGGLGHAFAEALAGRSRAMLLVGRDAQRLDALKTGLAAHHPGLVLITVAGDLTESTVRERVREAGASLPGGPDLLINAAGINDFRDFAQQASASIERLLDVNLLVPIQLTQLLLPLLETAPSAQVINIGSIFGYLGYPGFAAYCATKFGLRGFSQALRRELSDTTVRVRYFAPRAVRTALTTPAIAAMNRELKTAQDAPERVARMLVDFIARDTWERKIGFPERLYVLLNRLAPSINDKAIRAQLGVIRRQLGRQARTLTNEEREST
jgi:short-subunit dehydrogenase